MPDPQQQGQQTFSNVTPISQTFSDVTPVDSTPMAGNSTTADRAGLILRAIDPTGLGQIGLAHQAVGDWAEKLAAKNRDENQKAIAAGKEPPHSEYVNSFLGMLSSGGKAGGAATSPGNLALAGGAALANTNPITAVPVDAAIAAHGVYGVAKNAKAAVSGNPEAAESALTSGAEAVGGAAGLGEQLPKLPAAVKSAATTVGKTIGVVDPQATDLMTKAIKPGKNNVSWSSDVDTAMGHMKAAEQQLGHPVQSLDDALEVAAQAKKNLWSQYQAKLGQAGSATVDGNAIADAMMNSLDKRTAMQNPDLADKIKTVADTYRRDIPVSEAEDFLQSVNRDLHNYYAKNKVGQRVAQSDPEMAYTVAEGNALRQSLYDKLDQVSGPGAKQLKSDYGAISNVEAEMAGRKNVSARQQPQSLSEQMGTLYGYGRIAKGVLTMNPGDIVEGVADKAAANWLKERGTTDAMIQRAFKNFGGAIPNVPAAAPALAQPAATPAAAVPAYRTFVGADGATYAEKPNGVKISIMKGTPPQVIAQKLAEQEAAQAELKQRLFGGQK